jgi:hypothetical protein
LETVVNTEDHLATIARQMKQLTAKINESEQRARRLERQNQRLLFSLLAVVLLGTGSLYAVSVTPSAHAENLVQGLEADAREAAEALGQAASNIEHAVEHDVMAERAAFVARMESLRADLNKVDDMEQHAAATVAVLLHDIKAMLEAMPGMANNMAIMTHDVNRMTFYVDQMNYKMGVITGGIDSTMGRMGRMMPGW